MTEISKAYEPQAVEEKWYARWLADECFTADPASAKPAYSIVIPPPNVTGVLTLTTSLLEVGENNRFRFELGALPLVGAVVAVAWLVEGLRGHRPGRTGAEPVPARAGSTGPELTRTGA